MIDAVALALGAGALVATLVIASTARKQRARLRRIERRVESATLASLGAARWAVESAALGDADRPSTLPPQCRASSAEDVLLWALFEGKRSGVFVEAGAFDGRRHSVSHVFESAGWTGLLVEATPEHAESCRAYRTASVTRHAALVGDDRVRSVRFLRVAEDGEPSGSMSHVAEEGDLADAIDVPAMTLDTALRGFEGPIDWVVLDIEGGEADALRGFDTDRWRPRVLVIEQLSTSATDDRREREVVRLLDQRGYQLIRTIARNGWYVRADDGQMLDRLQRLTTPV